MEKYNVISYRLKRDTKPMDVLYELERLLQKYNVFYSECLLCLRVMISEVEYEGKLHSNRKKNAVLTILKRHPELNDFFTHENIHAMECLTIKNFCECDLSISGEIEYSLVKDIVEKIPRPYAVNDTELIFNKLGFERSKESPCGIRVSERGWGAPVGNYISYSRTKYGDEKHSYVCFSANDENIDSMRELFFEFAKNVPGKYERTEYHS